MPFNGPDDQSLPPNIKALPESERKAFVGAFNSAFSECEKRKGTGCESRAFAIATAAAGKEYEGDQVDLVVDLALGLLDDGQLGPTCERCGGELDESAAKSHLAGMSFCADCTAEIVSNVITRFDKQLEKHYQPKDKRMALPFRKERNLPIEGFKLLPNRMWIAAYSNTFYDLEGERFSKKGFEEDIVFSRQNDLMPQLWFYHLPVPHGETLYMGLFSDHAIAIGKFHEGEIADKMIAYYEKHPNLAVSHGYVYNPEDLNELGVYEKFHTFEISPLPKGKEANPVTVFNLLEENIMSKVLNPEAVAELEKALGDVLAGRALESGKASAAEGIKMIQGFKASTGEEAPDKKKDDEEEMPFNKELLVQIAGVAAKAAANLANAQVKALEAATTKLAQDVAGVLLQMSKRLDDLEKHGPITAPLSPAGASQHKGLDFQALVADMGMNADGGSDKQLGGQPAFMSVLDAIVPNGRR